MSLLWALSRRALWRRSVLPGQVNNLRRRSMGEFRYAPSKYVPFRDVEAIARCRAIKREDIDKHRNPDFRIRVVKDADVPFLNLTDFVTRVKRANDENKRLVM